MPPSLAKFLKTPRIIRSLFTGRTRLFLVGLILLFSARNPAKGQGYSAPTSDLAATPEIFRPITGAIYESAFRDNTVEIFSPNGSRLGMAARLSRPTGIAFDAAGNLFIASDDIRAYAIKKVSAVDGTISTFTTTGLNGPHSLAFDQAGNLYVANNISNTVVSYTPNGVATVFADQFDGLNNPIGLAFDTAGNLFVTNAHGGSNRGGKVIKVTPEGIGTAFADAGFQTAYGIALDAAGNVYVSNNGDNRVEKFAPDGTDLGVFCSSNLNAPLGIMFDASGNLYVANGNSATIEKFAPDGTDLGVFANTRAGPHFMAISFSRQMRSESGN